MSKNHLNSRWRKGALRVTGAIVQGAWNRNLAERERSISEIEYVASFNPFLAGWHNGARVRRVQR